MMHLCYHSCTQLEREIKSFWSLIFWAASGFNPIRIKTSIERFLSLSLNQTLKGRSSLSL